MGIPLTVDRTGRPATLRIRGVSLDRVPAVDQAQILTEVKLGHYSFTEIRCGAQPRRSEKGLSSSIMNRKDLLNALLVHHRELRTPQDVGWRGTTSGGPGRPRDRISAELFAKSLGVSKPYYLKIENGQQHPKAEELEQIAELLKMTWRARAALYRRALGCTPVLPAPPRPETTEPVLRQALLEPQASCLTDLAYNIRSHNDQFTALLPHAATGSSADPRPNLIRATLLRPQATQWADNSTEWAEELTAELAEAAALHPDNHELLELHEEVAADPVAGPVYADAHRYVYPDRDGKVVISHSFPELNTRQVILVSD
ncbi:helix-turn-helix domain-containing protein [Streptomyces decoyicus]|uniref:helix-turn-helix domain-containing protein n=1 Tax=Streptomyces decoyicus TaxID=249567 RepID=UPI0036375DD3